MIKRTSAEFIEYCKQEKAVRYLFPAILFLLNVGLKSWYLNGRSIAGDEPFTLYHAQMSIPSILAELSKGNNPPLFEIMLHYWIQFFGLSAFSVRFLPMLFSSATVCVVYKLGIRFFNIRVAVAASLMFTFSNFNLLYSHEARVYTFACFLACVSMYSFIGLFAYPKSRRYFLILSFSNILLAYSHFFGLFIPFVQLSCCLVYPQVRKRMGRQMVFFILFFLLAYSPYIRVLFIRFYVSAKAGTWVAPVYLADLYRMIPVFLNSGLNACVAILIVAGACIKMFVQKSWLCFSYKILVYIWFLLPYCTMFTVSWIHFPYPVPMFIDRYLIFYVPALYLSLALLMDDLYQGFRLGGLLCLAFLAMFCFRFHLGYGSGRQIEQVVEKVKALKIPGAMVVICPIWFDLNFTFYYEPKYFSDIDEEDIMSRMHDHLRKDKIYVVYKASELDSLALRRSSRIIYIDNKADLSMPNNKIRPLLNDLCKLVDSTRFSDDFSVYVYESLCK